MAKAKTEMKWYDEVSLAVGIIGLAFGIIAWRDAKRSDRRLLQIDDALSTRYLGEFPDFITSIVKLLEGAKREIIILCDVPAYGVFTDPNNWTKYKSVIEQKLDSGITVSFICVSHERLLGLHEKRLSVLAPRWNVWRKENQSLLQAIYDRHILSVAPGNCTPTDLIDAIAKAHQKALDDVFSRGSVSQIDSVPALYFWVVDGIEAVFSIPNVGQHPTEFGFTTHDPKLLEAFKGIHEDMMRGRGAA